MRIESDGRYPETLRLDFTPDEAAELLVALREWAGTSREIEWHTRVADSGGNNVTLTVGVEPLLAKPS